jgi:hypothetical protein
MLFKILELFGLDVRAEIEMVRGQIEQRGDEYAVRAKQTALSSAGGWKRVCFTRDAACLRPDGEDPWFLSLHHLTARLCRQPRRLRLSRPPC